MSLFIRTLFFSLSLVSSSLCFSDIYFCTSILNQNISGDFESLSKNQLRLSQEKMSFYFFVSDINQLEVMENINPGESFTVILSYDDKLIIGRKTPGDSPWLTGSSGSHDTLLAQYSNVVSEQGDYTEQAGAIRFNADNSIDISGFHESEPSLSAAIKIKKAVLKLFPTAQIRITEDRLKTLKAK